MPDTRCKSDLLTTLEMKFSAKIAGSMAIFFSVIACVAVLRADDQGESAKKPDNTDVNAEAGDPGGARALLKERLAAQVSWQKIAIFPERWIDKEVSLCGWLDFDVSVKMEGYSSRVIYLYESREAMELRLSSRSVKMGMENLLPACNSDPEVAKAILLNLRGKCVRITGTANYPWPTPYSLAYLDAPLKIQVLRGQPLGFVPGELIAPELPLPDSEGESGVQGEQ